MHKIQFDLTEELEDIMIDINQQGLKIDKDIYISNSDTGQIRCKEFSDIEVFETNPEIIGKCYVDFTNDKDCDLFLEHCEKTYGIENVKVKFGTIVYYI